MYGFPCEMDFSPLISEPHPRRKRLGWDSETRGEKNPSHMENHTKCISSNGTIIGTIHANKRARHTLEANPQPHVLFLLSTDHYDDIRTTLLDDQSPFVHAVHGVTGKSQQRLAVTRSEVSRSGASQTCHSHSESFTTASPMFLVNFTVRKTMCIVRVLYG